MKKIIFRIFTISLLIVTFLILYLSTIGIVTNKFNSQIISQIKNIDPDFKIKMNDVSVKLNIFSLTLDAKTVGTDLILRNKIIKIENIKSKISLNAIISNKFAVSEISISTKSLQVKDLISFIRQIKNDPKLFIAENLIKNGFVIANLRFEFDEFGKIKKNYFVNGFVNNGHISFLDKNFNKLNFIFKIEDHEIKFKDVSFLLNNKKMFAKEISINRQNNEFNILGEINNKKLIFKQNELNNIIKDDFLKKNLNEIKFSSDNKFSFKIDKKFNLSDLNIKSKIAVDLIEFKNISILKNYFPNIKNNLTLKNQNIELDYNKNNLEIAGSGDIFIQNEPDVVKYKIKKKQKEFIFDIDFKISNNPVVIELVNYEKNKKSLLNLSFSGKLNKKNELFLRKISISENKNILEIRNLKLSKNYKINDIGNVKLNFLDKDKLYNKIQIEKNEKNYIIGGDSFNINRIITELLDSKNSRTQKIFNKNINLIFNINEIYLDKNNTSYDLKGFLFLDKNNEIIELNLESEFSNKQKIKFTIKTTDNNEKITTLYSNWAKPLVDRYKFIKGFEEGELDFYSIKKNKRSKSTLKIYDFKLKELPTLTKILTLASLQGIADLLSGEGIRFNEFEMNFSNKDNLMTIDEIYSIGPAISILMEGYVEKNNLISLRGTLVPATTINKTISSIPLLGDILVGKKTGEGVFGVSFKIKGPPKNLETSVNPIKTLTPRFITRTLEKIKKN